MTTQLEEARPPLLTPSTIGKMPAGHDWRQRTETASHADASTSQDFFALFSGTIDQNAVQKFFNNFALITQQEARHKHLHLLIQSYGGTVSDGIALFNLLRSAPLDVSVYNSGNVHSAAVIYFLAGKRRVASRHAIFMLHRPTCAPQLMTTGELASVLTSLEFDEQRLEGILRSFVNFPEDQWADFKSNDLWLTADDALRMGLVTEIGEFSPPPGAPIFSFNL